jgi:hypothetical protein
MEDVEALPAPLEMKTSVKKNSRVMLATSSVAGLGRVSPLAVVFF